MDKMGMTMRIADAFEGPQRFEIEVCEVQR